MSMRFKLFVVLVFATLALVWRAATLERPASSSAVDKPNAPAPALGTLSAEEERLLRIEHFGEAASLELEALEDEECPPIRWESTLESAFDRAQREGKPVFIAFSVRTLGDPDSKFF